MQMKLPRDQAPIWTGQEDLLHLVPPPSIALTRGLRGNTPRSSEGPHYDGESHTYFHVQIAPFPLFLKNLIERHRRPRRGIRVPYRNLQSAAIRSLSLVISSLNRISIKINASLEKIIDNAVN